MAQLTAPLVLVCEWDLLLLLLAVITASGGWHNWIAGWLAGWVGGWSNNSLPYKELWLCVFVYLSMVSLCVVVE